MADYATEMKAIENLMKQEEESRIAEKEHAATGSSIAGILSPLIGTGDVKGMKESWTGRSRANIDESVARQKNLLDKYQTLSKMENAKELAKYQQSFKPPVISKGQEKLETEFAKSLNEYDIQGGSQTIATNIKKMEDVVRQLEAEPGKGRVETGTLRAIGPTSGVAGALISPKLTALRAQLESAIQGTLKPILGAQFAAIEGMMIFQRAFNAGQPNEVNAKKIKFEIENLKNRVKAFQMARDYWNSHNQSLVGYKGNVDDFLKSQQIQRGETPQLGDEPMAEATKPVSVGKLEEIGKVLGIEGITSVNDINWDSLTDDQISALEAIEAKYKTPPATAQPMQASNTRGY